MVRSSGTPRRPHPYELRLTGEAGGPARQAMFFEPRCGSLTEGAQMLRFLRNHEEDGLYFLAAVCLIGVGAITGILLAALALSW